MAGLAKTDLIILDDWGLAKFSAEQRRDLLELLDDRHGNRSTVVTSQVPVDHWHDVIGDPTLGDAILDRLVHNAYRINLKGESLRKRYSKLTTAHPFGVTMYRPASLRSHDWPSCRGMGGSLHTGIGGRLARNPHLPTQKRIASHDPERLVDLMVAYQRGDSDAFEQLYLALKPQIYGYLIQVTWDRGWAEDLLQETFLQLHRARRTYQPGRAVLPWVFAIARHVYLASRRSQARRHSRETQYPEPEMATLSISLELERLADHELIGRALTAVPEERREVLLLHHMWGFTFAEIGAMLGIRAGTAKVRAHRGMRDLRHELDLLTDT